MKKLERQCLRDFLYDLFTFLIASSSTKICRKVTQEVVLKYKTITRESSSSRRVNQRLPLQSDGGNQQGKPSCLKKSLTTDFTYEMQNAKCKPILAYLAQCQKQ